MPATSVGRDLPRLSGVRCSTKLPTVDQYAVLCAVLYMLRTGCQGVSCLASFPNIYVYWHKWSQADQDGISVLELALKKSGWGDQHKTEVQRAALQYKLYWLTVAQILCTRHSSNTRGECGSVNC